MLKKILAIVAMLYAVVAMAAVDVNKASSAELDSVKGIGPGTSKLILDERKKGDFKDWNDFITRVKGVGEVRASKLSAEGLTVGGTSYKPAASGKKDEKKAETKSDKKDTKAAAKQDKQDTKAAAKEEKQDTKAAAAKPAASAASGAKK